MRNGNLLKSRASEIGVKRICVNHKVVVDANIVITNITSYCKVASSKGAFTNNVYKICLFLTIYPLPFTFSMV